jgi:hypothetical protein
MLCKRRRIKPTQKFTSLGMTRIEHISEGMCRQCAWERIKHKCKICDDIIGKGYPRLLAHITSHYTTNELLYKEDIEMDIISINFKGPKTSNEVLADEEERYYPLKCRICGDTFSFKKGDTMFSKWIDHTKSHYIDKDIVKKERVAKDIIHLNYDSVLLLQNGNNVSSSIYRDLTERERNAYRNALYRIKSEESITKSKGR